MLVFCEECGKRYSFPPEEVEAGSGQFRCRACGFLMTTDMLVRVVIREEEGILPSPPSDTDSDGISPTSPKKTKEGV